MPGVRTYSVLEKLRTAVGRAEGAVKRAATRHADLQAQWKVADDETKRRIARRGEMARLELRNAEANLANARSALRTEEMRLMEPDSFLRFS